MPLQFNVIPGNARVPLWYAEFNPGVAPYDSISRLLLIGQKLSAGSATANAPILVTGGEDGLFGSGSMLAMMYKIARANAPMQEIWCLPIADAGGATAASGLLTMTAPTGTGEVILYIAGRKVRISVSPADIDEDVADKMVAAINADVDLPVTAEILAGDGNEHKVTVTAKNKGTPGNTIRLELGLHDNEGPLSPLVVAITQMASGATDPSLATPLAALGDDVEFDFIAAPYTDSTNFGLMTTLLNDSTGRWSPTKQLYGHYFTFKADTAANLATFGGGKNDQHISVMGAYKSPTPSWEWAAAFGAIAAVHLQDAPELSRPLHTLVMQGILPPKSLADRFGLAARQTLLFDGISTYHVNRDGTVAINRAITTYQTNPWGSPDATWLDVETMFQATYIVRYLKAKVTQTWGRAALRSDNPTGLQGVATPDAVRDTILHGYRELSVLNVVENEAAFRDGLIVQRSESDANRLEIYLPADHVNQLRITAVNITSFMQLPVA